MAARAPCDSKASGSPSELGAAGGSMASAQPASSETSETSETKGAIRPEAEISLPMSGEGSAVRGRPIATLRRRGRVEGERRSADDDAASRVGGDDELPISQGRVGGDPRGDGGDHMLLDDALERAGPPRRIVAELAEE